MIEKTLKGGQSTESVIRIGNTIHRLMGTHSEYVHKLLKLLEEKNYSYSPKFLGIDNENREILTFMQGNIATNIKWTDEMLKKVVLMMRELHDSTSKNELAGEAEVVCHRDLAPWNTVLVNNEPTGFIDFDDAGPGQRVNDLAYFLWTFFELGKEISAEAQVNRIRYLCDIYNYSNGIKLVDTILEEQKKVLAYMEDQAKNSPNQELQKISADRVEDIKVAIKWVEANRNLIQTKF